MIPTQVMPGNAAPACAALQANRMMAGQRLEADALGSLKGAIWLYLLLLIFEGALRKWVMPGLSTPLLVVRDPIAIWLLLSCWKRGLLPATPYLILMMFMGLLGVFTATLIGHGDLLVALYGARILLVHFPLIFVIGCVLKREDVIRMGKFLVFLAIPMAVLITLQFYSPQSAWVNRGVGGDMEGAGFSGALGYMRPPATFSFTKGTHMFFGLVACFILYFWLTPKGINRLMLILATCGLILAIPLSISRSLFFHVAITCIFSFITLSRKPKFVGRALLAVLGGTVILAFLSQTSLFQTATEVFTSRFENASDYKENGLEGVLLDRYLGGLLGALSSASEQPFFGYGIGMGTNVGSMLLTGGLQYLIAEGEWGRLVGEMGPLFGLIIILIRLSMSFKLSLASYNRLVQGDVLPWMLLSYVLLTLPQAQWQQPTSLGFCVLSSGLIVASIRGSNSLRD